MPKGAPNFVASLRLLSRYWCSHTNPTSHLQRDEACFLPVYRCGCSNEKALVVMLKGADPLYQIDLRADPPCTKRYRPGTTDIAKHWYHDHSVSNSAVTTMDQPVVKPVYHTVLVPRAGKKKVPGSLLGSRLTCIDNCRFLWQYGCHIKRLFCCLIRHGGGA